jgi:hypothetical protein
LAYRQDSLKIGVEGTIALDTTSEQNVDWAKAGSQGDEQGEVKSFDEGRQAPLE